MLSFRTKRKPVEAISQSLTNSSKSNNENMELIEGSLQLIDLLYQHITKTGLGLCNVQSFLQNNIDRSTFYEEATRFIETIETATTSLFELAKQLSEGSSSEEDAFFNCYQAEQTKIRTSIAHLQTLSSKSLSLLENEDCELASYLNQLQKEVLRLEQSTSACDNFVTSKIKRYGEQVSAFQMQLASFTAVFTDISETCSTTSELKADCTSLALCNSAERSLLTKHEHDNMILLNDLISFLTQLRSMITSLKEDLTSIHKKKSS